MADAGDDDVVGPRVRVLTRFAGRIATVVPPADFAPRCAAAITSSSPPVTTTHPRSARRRPTASASASCSGPLPITATWRARAILGLMERREARGGTLVLGGGFAGAYVARLLGERGATIVSPENFMLYTPLLPEAASGTLEPRHVVVPLRDDVPARGAPARPRARARRPEREAVDVETAAGAFEIALRAARRRARRRPADAADPGPRRARARASSRSPTRSRSATTCCAQLEAADAEPDQDAPQRAPRLRLRRRRLRGRRGARRARTTSSGTRCAPTRRLRGARAALGARRRRAEDPPRDPAQARRVRRPRARAAAASRSTSARRLESVDRARAVLATGRAIPTRDARLDGRRAARTRCSRRSACRSTTAAASSSTRRCASRARRTCGRSATARASRTRATPGGFDPPTCQHALRQARRLARTSRRAAAVPLPDARPGGDARPLQGHRRRPRPAPARLPRLVRRRARTTSTSCRSLRRKLRVVADWTVSLAFRRDIAELCTLGHPRQLGEH